MCEFLHANSDENACCRMPNHLKGPIQLQNVLQDLKIILPEISEVKKLLKAAEQAKEEFKASRLLLQLNELERMKIACRKKEEELQYSKRQSPLARPICATLTRRNYFPSSSVLSRSTTSITL